MTPLQYRILELSYKHRLSHIGSCLGAAPILDEIYSLRKPDEPVILSAGHCGLTLYCVLEKYEGKNAEDLLNRHGVHPTKNKEDGIWCSTGSLGQGLSVAVGRALADMNRNVWCYITDGECAEGVVYESLNLAERNGLWNLKVFCNWNGYGAYRESDPFMRRLVDSLFPMEVRMEKPDDLGIPFLKGQDAHYYTMTKEDWEWTQREWEKSQQEYVNATQSWWL